jgi:deoxyribodipyrimidine photolyase-related protein
MEAVLVFPHHLFEKHPAFGKDRIIFLIEDPRFFSDFKFHKKKLILHRASLKSFQKQLKKKGFKTHYVEGHLEQALKLLNITAIHLVDFDDSKLTKTISALVKKQKISMQIYPSPGFLTSCEEFSQLFEGKKHFSCQTFYIYQRKKLGLLLDETGKPLGGKWSFDVENRKKIPKNLKIPKFPKFSQSPELKEAVAYVAKKYPNNPGLDEDFNYPTNHAQAKKALDHFLEMRLHHFGEYEDAIVENEEILFHSCLSPILNVGLLTPKQVIDATISYSKRHDVPINSLEGFIRQLIGWREFVRCIYHAIGEKQRSSNFFKHKHKISQAFYDGSTTIVPIDAVIKKLLKTGYLHHIERLMVLGNFFLLCEISPDAIYRWFMELFIDSYDWVMVPNVYGMSQYADGGMMTTKPYFSGSNYILKMSDFKTGSWCKIWDALFWRFMIKNDTFFQKQPRLKFLSQLAKKKKKDRELSKLGDQFLERLF